MAYQTRNPASKFERRCFFSEVTSILDKNLPENSNNYVIGGSFPLRVLCDHLADIKQIVPSEWVPNNLNVYIIDSLSLLIHGSIINQLERALNVPIMHSEHDDYLTSHIGTVPFKISIYHSVRTTWEHLSESVDISVANVFLIKSAQRPNKAVFQYATNWWVVVSEPYILSDIKSNILRVHKSANIVLGRFTMNRVEKYIKRGFVHVMYQPRCLSDSEFDDHDLNTVEMEVQ